MAHIDTSAHLNRWRNKSLAEKSLLSIGMLLIAVCVPSWPAALMVAAIMIGVTIFGAGVPFKLWWTVMTAPISFLFLGVATVLVQFHGWHVSLAPHGVEIGGRLAARAFAGLNCLIFLSLTTPATDLVAGLRRLGVPAEIAEMTLLMYRFVFLLLDTADNMNAAQAARLGHSNYRRHMNSLSLLIANLMPRAFSRAQALEVGLAARGWSGELRVLSPVRPASMAGLGVIFAAELVVLAFGWFTT